MDGDCSGAAKMREAAANLIAPELASYRCQHCVDEDGGGVSLIDALTPVEDQTVERGVDEVRRIADAIAGEIAHLLPVTCRDYERGRAEALAEAAEVVLFGKLKISPVHGDDEEANVRQAAHDAIRALAATPPTHAVVRVDDLRHLQLCGDHIDGTCERCARIESAALEGGTDGE